MLVQKQQQKSNNIPCKLCLTPSYLPDIKWSPQTLLNAVASAATSSLLRRASQVARRSKLKACFLGFHLDTIAGIRQYPLSFSVLERFEQPSTAQRFTITRKLQDYLQIGPRTHIIRFVLMLVLHFAKSRDVTSEMGLFISFSISKIFYTTLHKLDLKLLILFERSIKRFKIIINGTFYRDSKSEIIL